MHTLHAQRVFALYDNKYAAIVQRNWRERRAFGKREERTDTHVLLQASGKCNMYVNNYQNACDLTSHMSKNVCTYYYPLLTKYGYA